MRSDLQARRDREFRARGWWFRVASVAVVVAVAGCAAGGISNDSTPEMKAAAVKERSSARWAALIKGDKDAAYAYLSPGTREMVSLEQFRGRVQAGSFRSVQIDKVECDAETCKVKLLLTYDYLPAKGTTTAKGITTYVEETWVLDKGQAWFVGRP